jgi:formiminotetrahydrofolate cyclodeaminase
MSRAEPSDFSDRAYDGRTIGSFLEALAAPGADPAGGGVVALACSCAAALVELAAPSREMAERSRELRTRALALGPRDAEGYQRLASGDRSPEAREEAAAGPRALAEAAREIGDLAAVVRPQARPSVRGDVVVAGLLAEACARAAEHLVQVDLGPDA